MRIVFIFAYLLPFFLFAATKESRDEVIRHAEKSKSEHNFSHAETLYRSWIDAHPDDDEVSFFLAQVLSWQNKFAESETIYLRILESNPENLDAELALARLLSWRGKNKESLKKLDRLRAIEPDNSEVRDEWERVHAVIEEQRVGVVRFASDFETFDFFANPSLGFRTGFSFMERGDWAIRVGAYGLQRFDIGAFQGAIGGTYWLTPQWLIELDGEVATRGDILPQFAGTIGTSLTLANTITPSLSFRYALYSEAAAYMISPELNWSILPELEITGKLFAALTSLPQDKNVPTISGLARVNFLPFEYFSLFTGVSTGEEAFDPGNPALPLRSFFSQHLFAGLKFTIEGHIGAEISVDREWRNNNQNIAAGEFSVFYTW